MRELIQVLQPVTAIIICIVTLWANWRQSPSPVARERIDLVYRRLFLEIEPYLYKQVSDDDISSFVDVFNRLAKKHSLLISPDLLYAVAGLEKSRPLNRGWRSKKAWFHVCDKFSKDYDSLCRRAHLPVRGVIYRINTRQYKSKLHVLLAAIFIFSPQITVVSLVTFFAFPNVFAVSVPAFFVVLLYVICNSQKD